MFYFVLFSFFLIWWLKMFFLCFHIFFLQEGASFDAYFAAVWRTQYFWYLYRSFYCKIKTIKYMYICIHLFSFHLFFICLKNRCIYGKIKTNSSHMCILVMSVFENTNFQKYWRYIHLWTCIYKQVIPSFHISTMPF